MSIPKMQRLHFVVIQTGQGLVKPDALLSLFVDLKNKNFSNQHE